MGVTRVYSPIQGEKPLFGWVKFDDQWQKVKIIAHILERGTSKNAVEFENGEKKEVLNDSIKFSKPRTKK